MVEFWYYTSEFTTVHQNTYLKKKKKFRLRSRGAGAEVASRLWLRKIIAPPPAPVLQSCTGRLFNAGLVIGTGTLQRTKKNFKNYITLPDFLKLQESSTLCWNIYSSWAHCGSIHDEKCRIHVNSQVCRNILHTFEKNPVLQKINKLKFSPRYFIIVANIFTGNKNLQSRSNEECQSPFLVCPTNPIWKINKL